MNRDLFGYRDIEPDRRIINGPTLDFVLHHETEAAIKIFIDGSEARAAWLPKSAVEIFRGSLKTPATRESGQRVVLPVVTVTVPEGLAKEKGLI